MAIVLVQGCGDIGSAVAWRLRAEGHAVVIQDATRPPHARRGMAFTDALFDGTCVLDGVLAKRASGASRLARMLACGRALPVTDEGLDAVLASLEPEVLVDARVHKHAAAPRLLGRAPLTIGLGPGFEAGVDADLAVETAWGEDLGAVVRRGRAKDPGGEPRRLAGHGRERYVYADTAGTFRTDRAIGDPVRVGDPVAWIGDSTVHAPLSGILRGLSHAGAGVHRGAKVVEVDAGGDRDAAFGRGERPKRIAEGVVAALMPLRAVAGR